MRMPGKVFHSDLYSNGVGILVGEEVVLTTVDDYVKIMWSSFAIQSTSKKCKMSSKSVKSLFSHTKNGATQNYSYVITISIIAKITTT